MPSTAIPGFVKKRAASQRYRRSPRQLTRDISVALEMRDEKVLPHLKLLTEDGEVLDGEQLTGKEIKVLRREGRNPMWYLRSTWLEETYGRREKGEPTITETEESEEPSVSTTEAPATEPGIVGMLKETIVELKKDKELLTNQITIKDNQIKETTERWKESNYLSQGLHKRLEAMEQWMDLTPRDQLPEQPVAGNEKITVEPIEPMPQSAPPKSRAASTAPSTTAKPKPTSQTSSPRSSAKPKTQRKPRAKKQAKPKWYEVPTLKKFISRD